MVNYGHLHIVFDDGSVGWYEAGWGPMMSETAFFVKDMIGPNGCVSIVAKEAAGADVKSSDHDAHTRTNALRIHHAALDAKGRFVTPDTIEVNGGRAGPSGAVRARAAAVLESDPRRGRPHQPLGRRDQFAAHRVRGGREHADRAGRQAVGPGDASADDARAAPAALAPR